jgi:2-polyprenyl-3-methyl-5-hydroxy-6-metoxy-1,4-benzoquinol methylase
VERLPWFTERLDPDISAAIGEIGSEGRRLLTIGEGPGTQAIELARLGWKVTATDVSRVAVAKAKKRAARTGAPVEFLEDDIVSTSLTGPYAVVVDRGCFHTLEPFKRPAYVRNVRRLLEPDGYLILKTFSKAESGPGPFRFNAGEIRDLFEGPFVVQQIREAFFGGVGAGDRKALFSVLRAK